MSEDKVNVNDHYIYNTMLLSIIVIITHKLGRKCIDIGSVIWYQSLLAIIS